MVVVFFLSVMANKIVQLHVHVLLSLDLNPYGKTKPCFKLTATVSKEGKLPWHANGIVEGSCALFIWQGKRDGFEMMAMVLFTCLYVKMMYPSWF